MNGTMNTDPPRRRSVLGTAWSLWQAQRRISGGMRPALLYAMGRARELGFRRLIHLLGHYARTQHSIPEPKENDTLDHEPSTVEKHWSGYEQLSAFLSSPPPPVTGGPLDLIEVSPDRLAKALAGVRFPPCEEPLVSIIIPFHNQCKYTVECLLALSQADDHSVPYEILLADDASSEPDTGCLSKLDHVNYLRSETNLGFLRTCNRAAKEARGHFLVFLNNDTQVMTGWLKALVDVFLQHSDAGIAGPKVLYPSGHLQEAGGVIRADLTVEMVGLNDDSTRPCYNVRRAVDYCSGVCMIVERALFHSLGGFSDELAPAYYEDVDLCLKVRQAGKRVYYEPRSVIVHHLSQSHASSGNDSKGALIARNRQRMFTKWQEFVDAEARVRLIAFYLPQYHPIPENDSWWGQGFTEWRNVASATPVFSGHVQPRLPGDLGFYDLRVPDVIEQQAELARRYGVEGFCFYYYWFGGKRILEMPLERMLSSGRPDFPFCLCWANENWTRRWDGQEKDVLMAQAHSPEDDEAVIHDLMRYMRDPRYIRIKGRPLLLVYRTSLFPDMQATSARWREVCRREGLGDICLAGVESFGESSAIGPGAYGFDFTVAFPPHGTPYRNRLSHLKLNRSALVYHYRDMVQHAAQNEMTHLSRFLGVCPGWDNTPRRKVGSTIFAKASPGDYQAWLEWTIRQTRRWHQDDERLIFVNAWNEWAEGAVLEPDAEHGHAYLEATRNALFNTTVH